MLTPKLAIFDFDGTLFDTHASIAHCISLTFTHYAQSAPPASAIRATIATGVGLNETFQMLHVSPTTNISDKPSLDVSSWISTYRSLYTSLGLPLITPFPGADSLLRKLKEKGIPVVIVSNKGIEAVEAVLKNAGMEGLVEMVLGDMPGVRRKPDPMSYFEIIAPVFGGRCGGDEGKVGQGSGLDPKGVMMVGDTAADIQFARNIGAMACWARYGYGKKEECEKMGPEVVIESLEGFQTLICGKE